MQNRFIQKNDNIGNVDYLRDQRLSESLRIQITHSTYRAFVTISHLATSSFQAHTDIILFDDSIINHAISFTLSFVEMSCTRILDTCLYIIV